MKKLFSLLLFLLLLAASCNKAEPENPLDNVVRCKINGVPWVAQCEGNIVFGCEAVDCLFSNYKDSIRSLQLNAISTLTKKKIYMWYLSDKNNGINNYKSKRNEDVKYIDNTYDKSCSGFYLDTLKSNKLNLMFDTILFSDRIGTVTGSFYFTVANTCGDTVKITDGYFRTSYR